MIMNYFGTIEMPLSIIPTARQGVYREDGDIVEWKKLSYEAEKFTFVVRKCYPIFYDDTETESLAIIGVPGIGKSVSLLYPLLRHLKEKFKISSFISMCTKTSFSFIFL